MPKKTLCLEANAPWALNHLDDKGRAEDGTVCATCPVCHEAEALSVEMFEGRFRVECSAGCEVHAIATALEMPPPPYHSGDLVFAEWLNVLSPSSLNTDNVLAPVFALIAKSPKLQQADELRKVAARIGRPVGEVRSAFKAATKVETKSRVNGHRPREPASAEPDQPPTVHAAKDTAPPVRKYWILDTEGYAALINDRWAAIGSKQSLRQHMIHDDHVDLSTAKYMVEEVPPAQGFVFHPSRKERAWKEGGRWRLNTWYGLPEHAPKETDGEGYAAIIALFTHLFGADLDWALDWHARPLKSLHEGHGAWRNHTAIVLYGPQGAGKGWLSEILAELYGEHFKAAQHHVLKSPFVPGYLARTLLLFLDEVASNSATSDLEVLDRLKVWVTEDHNTEALKFKDAEAFDFLFNIVFASNHAQPLRPEETDRRYAFFEQTAPLPQDIVEALVREKRAGWPSMHAVLAMLLARPVERDRPKPPMNEARKTQLALGQDVYQCFCEELLDVGLAGVSAEWVLEQNRKEQGSFTWHSRESNGCVSVPIARLNQLFEWYCRNRGYKGGISAKLGPQMQRRIPGVVHRDKTGTWPRAVVAGTRTRVVSGVPLRGRDEDGAKAEPKQDGFFN